MYPHVAIGGAPSARPHWLMRATHSLSSENDLGSPSSCCPATGGNAMDLIADRGRRVTVEELNTTRLLAHARKQAHLRNLDDMVIVDVDAHHYENENYDEFLPFMENDVLRQLTMSGRKRNRAGITPTQVGYQDMGGRVTRYPLRGSEKTEHQTGAERDIQLGHRWMDSMSVDYSCLFPT